MEPTNTSSEADINILNVLEISALDLAFWINSNLMNVRVPVVGMNTTVNIVEDILPVLSKLANSQIVATEFYNVVTSSVPSSNSVKSSDTSGGVKEMVHELNKKKDILYRTIQTLESARETASRLMTGLTGPR
jgi:hypothetical protein